MSRRLFWMLQLLVAGCLLGVQPAMAEEAADIVLREAAAARGPVADAGHLLSATEIAEAEAAAASAGARGVRVRFVTAPAGVATEPILGRLAAVLTIGPEDALVLLSPEGAYAKAPALAGEGATIKKAFDESRRDFALGKGKGLSAYGLRLAELVEARRGREAGAGRVLSIGLALLVLGVAGRLGWGMLRAEAAQRELRASAQAAWRERAAALLYELGTATEDSTIDGHVLYLDGWKRFRSATESADAAAGEQLALFLQEALQHAKGMQ